MKQEKSPEIIPCNESENMNRAPLQPRPAPPPAPPKPPSDNERKARDS